MNARPLFVLAIFFFCVKAANAQSPASTTSSLVVRLGGDTVVVETYTIVNNHLYGKAFIRFYENHVRYYDVVFNSDGSIKNYYLAAMDPSNSSLPFKSKTRRFPSHVDMTFWNDTASFSFTGADGEEFQQQLPALSVDFIGGYVPIFPLIDWIYSRLKISGQRELTGLRTTNGWTVTDLSIRPLSNDTLAFGGPFIDYSKIIVGDDGIETINGIGSAYNFITTKTPPIDIELLARRLSKTSAMVDPSPRDTINFNYHGNNIKIEYGRPFRRGRVIFGGVVPYDSLWRMGANYPTQITFGKAVRIGKKNLAPGTYSLYAIPRKASWTLIFSNDLESWPTNPDRTKEVAHIKMEVRKTSTRQEQFTIDLMEKRSNGMLTLAWDDTEAFVDFTNSK